MTEDSETLKNNETAQLHLSKRFTDAVEYARSVHIEMRKGTDIPYMAHLLGVAALVMGEAGHAWCSISEEMVIAALLHDAAEDHGGRTRLKDIESKFGSDVARIVKGLSDRLVENPDEKGSWDERKEKYIRRLRKEQADVRLISVADKLYNAKAILDDFKEIGAKVFERFKRGADQQLWYFDELLRIFLSHPRNRIVNDLERVVQELHARVNGNPRSNV